MIDLNRFRWTLKRLILAPTGIESRYRLLQHRRQSNNEIRLATHEASHTVAALVLGCWVHRASIDPAKQLGSKRGGHTLILLPEDLPVEKYATIVLAGQRGEQLFLRRPGSGHLDADDKQELLAALGQHSEGDYLRAAQMWTPDTDALLTARPTLTKLIAVLLCQFKVLSSRMILEILARGPKAIRRRRCSQRWYNEFAEKIHS